MFFLGNTDPKKNVVGVMKAISKLRLQGKLSCTIVMPDIDKTFLEKTADKIGDRAVIDYIHCMNYVPNHELPAIYSMASVFLYPSLRESFGIPILEAMACEIPVLTSNTSSMPEVAGDAAVFVDPNDANSIAYGMASLIDDATLRERLVENSRQRIKLFSWVSNAQKTLAIYKTIASRETPG
jgi:glycosyltransferase involved in cell wall biosynthesis